MTQVKNDNTVKVHYTGKLTSGEVFDSSEGREPLEFKVGAGQMIKGFEDAVMGMGVDESKTVTLLCDDAYGPIQPGLTQDVPKTQLPPDMKVELGQQLVSKYEEQEIVVVVTKVTDSDITVDANHPLAGKDLVFDIKVVEIS